MNTRYFINRYIKLSISIRICFRLDQPYTRNFKVTIYNCRSVIALV